MCGFYGTAAEVEADSVTTKFIDPDLMYEHDDNGHIVVVDGNVKYSKTFQNIVNFLEAEYKSMSAQGGNAGVLGSLKRQLNAIRSNMVELFIGGISISDRDSLRDLVEDAVLNTRSAAKNGVGYGANTMGFYVTEKLLEEFDDDDDEKYRTMIGIINDAYHNTIKALYSTVINPVTDNDKLERIILGIIDNGGKPWNINTGEYDERVLTSIESEPAILHTIAKIITIMFTANQAILQAPSLTAHYY